MSKEKVVFRPLMPASGDLDTPLPPLGNRTEAMKAVDRMFHDRAKKALEEAGCTALDFLRANPTVSQIELAKRLNRGASALGLVMAVYEQASQEGIVRNVAKDLLIRHILAEFPKGWSSTGDVHPHVILGFWDSEVSKYAGNSQFGVYAEAVLDRLTIQDPPPEGWKPQLENEPLIDKLFDRFWPDDDREVE